MRTLPGVLVIVLNQGRAGDRSGDPPHNQPGSPRRMISIPDQEPALEQAPTQSLVDTPSRAFYRQAMEVLTRAQVPFLVGGAFAFVHQAGIDRSTKDLDIFVRPRDVHRLLEVCAAAGYSGEPGLLALAGEDPLARRLHRRHLQLGQRRSPWWTTQWFEHATEQNVLGLTVHGRAGGGEPLVEGVRHGARALRRGRRGPHHPRLRRPTRLAPAARAVRRRTGGCCWPT